MTATNARPAIRAIGLRKSYGTQVVLDGIDLEIAEGTVYALLGPNGAGKTTTVHILSTLIAADGGEAQIAGHDIAREPDAVRSVIGLTGQFSAVDGLFTGEENLRLMADLRHLGKRDGRRRVAELLERFDLVDAARKPVATYSGGMKRRLDLAMTLVGDPRIIFLDEPTSGLDPRSRRVMWEIIRELVARGVTIFLTTQDLDEADRLAHRIGVLDRGRLVAEGTPNELKRLVPGGHIRLWFTDAGELGRAAAVLRDGSTDDEGLTLQLPSDGGVHSLRALLDRLDAASIDIDGLAVQTADLDDVFLSLTGDTEREEVIAP
jgi:ABC-2 type transport system ATP-binding protein